MQTNKSRRENTWLLKSVHKLLAPPKTEAVMVAKAKIHTDCSMHLFGINMPV